jgi:hypothetical protein
MGCGVHPECAQETNQIVIPAKAGIHLAASALLMDGSRLSPG